MDILQYVIRRNLAHPASFTVYRVTAVTDWLTTGSYWAVLDDNRELLVDTACEHQSDHRDEVIRPGQLDPESEQYDERAAAIVAGRILGADVEPEPDDEPAPEPIGQDIATTQTKNTFYPCCQRNRSLGHHHDCEVVIAARVNVTLTRAAGWVAYNCPALTAEKWRALIAAAFLSWLPHLAERPEPVLALVRVGDDLVPTVMAREQVTNEPICDVLHGDGWEVN